MKKLSILISMLMISGLAMGMNKKKSATDYTINDVNNELSYGNIKIKRQKLIEASGHKVNLEQISVSINTISDLKQQAERIKEYNQLRDHLSLIGLIQINAKDDDIKKTRKTNDDIEANKLHQALLQKLNLHNLSIVTPKVVISSAVIFAVVLGLCYFWYKKSNTTHNDQNNNESNTSNESDKNTQE